MVDVIGIRYPLHQKSEKKRKKDKETKETEKEKEKRKGLKERKVEVILPLAKLCKTTS